MDWRTTVDRLFPDGHDVAADGDFLGGTGRSHGEAYAVIGQTNHADVGVELALRMAQATLAVVREHPGRPILFLIDTRGQRLRHRDELLGINRYMAHLAKCVELARAAGHAVIALVYDQALSGGFLASGMMADTCAALPEAEIRVMGLPAMARVTRIAEERLRALAAHSPVFGPGAANYVTMGAIDRLWDGDLAACLAAARAAAEPRDRRRALGQERGGRALAAGIAERVLDAVVTE